MVALVGSGTVRCRRVGFTGLGCGEGFEGLGVDWCLCLELLGRRFVLFRGEEHTCGLISWT